MALFRELDSTLKMLKTRQIDKEKELQAIVEKNLFEVLEMYFLASEYSTTFGGRIDTLAVDTFGCPVIIEYKRNKNDNVINQALSYLKWLQSQKQEFFEMLIQKKLTKETVDSIKLDWKNPRVICIAESYAKFDIDTVEVIPMRIELYKYKIYEDGIFSIDPVNVSETKEVKAKVTATEVVTTDYEALLSKGNPQVQELFLELRSRIFQIDEAIEEKIQCCPVRYLQGSLRIKKMKICRLTAFFT